MFSAASSGFALGASLIIAIGAQNAFILRQGLIRSHVFVLCLICALADGLLIAAGAAAPSWSLALAALLVAGGAALASIRSGG